MDFPWQKKRVWSALERLHYVGVITRVLARNRFIKNNNSWIRCVKLIRQPTEEDRYIFKTVKSTEVSNWRRNSDNLRKKPTPATNGDPDTNLDEPNDPANESIAKPNPSARNEKSRSNDANTILDQDTEIIEDNQAGSDNEEDEIEDEAIEDIVRWAPQWNPENQPHDFIYDLVEASGTQGLSSKVYSL